MPPRKKLGFNWRARQKSEGRESEAADRAKRLRKAHEDEGEVYLAAAADDTNAYVLPPSSKRKKGNQAAEEKKAKKLSDKQRKRLMKIVEAKEKKSRVYMFLNDAQYTRLACLLWRACPRSACFSPARKKKLLPTSVCDLTLDITSDLSHGIV